MFSRRVNNPFSRINFRLTAQFSAIFVITSLILFLIAYLLLSSTLKSKDHDELRTKFFEVWAQYQTGGLALVRREFALEELLGSRKLFFVRVSDQVFRRLFLIHPTRWEQFDFTRLDEPPPPEFGEVVRLESEVYQFSLEVISSRLFDGNTLQVGTSTEERDLFLRRFRGIFALVIVPLVALSFLGGLFTSFRSLRPIHSLTQAARSIIQTGRTHTRIPSKGTGDELDELILVFNQMLERIDTLIRGMREALDNVAHDLRTPLTRLRGGAEMALRSARDEEAYRSALADAIEESDGIRVMLKTLTDVTEAETGTMRLSLETVDLAKLVESVAEMYRYVAEEKDVILQTQLPETMQITADPARMRQAIGNVLDNAIKYTQAKGIVIVSARVEEGWATITVQDTGMGISDEDLPTIWDRLYRGKEARQHPGLGLGLSTVKAYVQAHGGSVAAASEEGTGSTFTIRVPNAGD